MEDNKQLEVDFRAHSITAMRDWVIENGMYPEIFVDLQHPLSKGAGASIPGDMILFNVHPNAVKHFNVNAGYMSFECRINGVVYHPIFHINSILQIQARDTTVMMSFGKDYKAYVNDLMFNEDDTPAVPNVNTMDKPKPILSSVKSTGVKNKVGESKDRPKLSSVKPVPDKDK